MKMKILIILLKNSQLFMNLKRSTLMFQLKKEFKDISHIKWCISILIMILSQTQCLLMRKGIYLSFCLNHI